MLLHQDTIFLNRKILETAIKLESVREEQENPLVESDNQQQIYRWVRTNLNLPLFQGQIFTERKLFQACKRRILDKSIYFEILLKLGVPKSTLTYFLKVILPSLQIFSLKHLWDLMGVGKTTKRIVREVIEKIVVTKKRGKKLTFSRTKSIHCGNIRNRWVTWTPKRYTDLHWWTTKSDPRLRWTKHR